MKLLVIGLGQCGGNITDNFVQINKRARRHRGIEIITGAYAVNTDLGDLSRLSKVKSDYRHRIVIGELKAGGHGVGMESELGADIAKEDADKVIDAIRSTPHFFETDAFLLIAGAAGGTGSGALPIITQLIKERYVGRPVYNLIVLPFEHEEQTERKTIYNSAKCLKSANAVADAIFLVDNERYVTKNSTLRHNLNKVNALVVEPFYNILCAGEEKKAKYLGGRVLDAGDIVQTITGWTAIGYGKSQLSFFRFPFWKSRDSGDKDNEARQQTEAMDQAIRELSFGCETADAARALYLVSAPAREINITIIQKCGEHFRSLLPQATIRNGDYPRGKRALEISLILSQLRSVEKVERYYADASDFASKAEKERKRAKD